MQKEFEKIEETADHLRQYVNARIDRMKLTAAEKASDVVSVFIAKALAGAVFFFFILFAGEAAAYGIGNYLGKTWLGFLIVAGCYLLAGLIIWIARERLLRIPIMNAMISRLFINEINEDGKD